MNIVILYPVQASNYLKKAVLKNSFYVTAAGVLKVTTTEKGIVGALFIDEAPLGQVCLPLPIQVDSVVLIGTEFQIKVWQAALKIPVGATTHYQSLASSLGSPRSYRAVARALGANKIACIIPCHRVIGKNGSLTGYAWGINKKEQLLTFEKSLEAKAPYSV
jgi:O-6-methylguanine DNA methyltransferase